MNNVNDVMKNEKTRAKMFNDLIFLDYYRRLELLALSCFKWENVPKSLNIRFLERTLYYYGVAVCYKHKDYGLLFSKVVSNGELNHYEEPTGYNAYSINLNQSLSADECVIIRNNPLMIPTENTLFLYARRLADMQSTIDVNMAGQKTPLLLVCDETQRNTLINLYNQYKGNMPMILGDKSLNLDSIKTFPTVTPYVSDKVMTQKKEVWNEVLTFLGINNANTDKRERLIVPEVESNNQHIEMSSKVMLRQREKACEEINKLFGTKMTVKFDDDKTEEIINEEVDVDDLSES